MQKKLYLCARINNLNFFIMKIILFSPDYYKDRFPKHLLRIIVLLILVLANMVKDDNNLHWFTARSSMAGAAGDTPTSSPVWVRPDALREHGRLVNSDGKSIVQAVGHTQISALTLEHPFFFLDCLGTSPAQSLLVHYSDKGEYDFEEYTPNPL